MTDQDYPKLPDLPPIGDVLNSIRSPNSPPAPARRLSPQELIAQLKEAFHGDTSKLIEALEGSTEFERETTCPLLRGAQVTCNESVQDGVIKIIQTKGGGREILCSRYGLVKNGAPPNSCYIGFDYKTCPFYNAGIF